MKLSWVKYGLKLKMGNGKVKKSIRLPIAEIIILMFGSIEGFLLGGFTGGLIGLALGGVILLTCILSIIPFVGQYLYYLIMMFAFSTAHVQLTNTFVVGFIYSVIISWLMIKETANTIVKRAKKIK